MEDKVKRPLLLTGLILALVSFAIFVIDCIVALIAVGSIMGESNLDPSIQCNLCNYDVYDDFDPRFFGARCGVFCDFNFPLESST